MALTEGHDDLPCHPSLPAFLAFQENQFHPKTNERNKEKTQHIIL